MDFYKNLKSFFIFLLIFAWIFTSAPLIWKIDNWRIPSKIEQAKAADGSGTNVVDPNTASVGGTDKTFEFTYTAAETMDSGEISITVPSGWSAPQDVSTTIGYTTATSTGMTADVLTALDTHTGWSVSEHITISADGTDKQEGSYSISASIAASAQAGEKWYFNEASAKDFGSATKMIFWIKSSVSTNAGELQFEVDDSADLASPLDTVNIPALTADTWTEVTISLGAARSSVLSYGIKYTTDIGAATVKIDDIRAMFDDADATTDWAIDDSGKGSTLSSEGTIIKQGTYSINTHFVAQEKSAKYYWSSATSRSFGSYTKVSFWIQSTAATVLGDLQWEVDNNQLLASPEDSINIPALSASTWTYVQVNLGATRTSILSYGINKPNDKGVHDEYIDAMAVQVNAAETTTNWTKTSSMVLSADTVVYHENAASLKNNIAATAGAGDKWWYNLGVADDWSGYTKVGFWIRSTVNTSAGDLQFEYDDNTGLASPIASLDIGALTANTWSYQNLTLTGTRTTINSYGFKYTTDIGAVTMNADDILLGPGNPSFSGTGPWDIKVRILALVNSQTITVTYGDNAGGGGGVTVTSSSGDHTFTTKSRISDSGTLTNITTSPVITVGAGLTVSSTGTQTSTMSIPSSNNYVGGAFTFISAGSQTVSEIIVSDTGTVTANSDISNLKIRYETAGTCTYNGDETLFNSTGVSFDASEQATATGTMAISTSQVCVYVILDVGSGASGDETLEIQITDPSTEVTVNTGTVSPATPVAISGTTTLETPDPNVHINTSGTQKETLGIPSTDNYLGGVFTFIQDETGLGSVNVTQIIISETGTVEADADLSNVKLFYKQEATCATSSIPIDAAAFNSTGVGFSLSKATTTGTMSVGESQVCVYVQLDVGSGASPSETLEIQIDSSSDVTVSDGTVSLQSTPLAIAGTTTLQAIISVTVNPSSFNYGILGAGGSERAIDSAEVPDLGNYGILVTNHSVVPVDLYIYGDDATGDETWTLSSGALQYTHEFIQLDETGNPVGNWTALDYSANKKILDTSVAASSTMEFDLQITTPNSSQLGTIVSVPVTVLATEAEELPVTSGLVLQLDADAIEGLSDNDLIGQWNDLSGNDNHATQSTESYKPLYKTNVLSGKPVVRFDGSDYFVLPTSPLNTAFNSSSGFTIFIILKTEFHGSWVSSIGTTTDRYLLFRTNSDYDDFRLLTSDGNHDLEFTSNVIDGNPHLTGVIYDVSANEAFLRFDGSQDASRNTATQAECYQPVNLGRDSRDMYYFTGDIAEVLIYNRVLTSGELSQVENYLGVKWLDW